MSTTAMARDPQITPTQQQLDSAARELQRFQEALPSDLWARLVRCKAMAMARVAIAQRHLGLTPTGRWLINTKPGAWDARRAAANDLDDKDE